MSRKLVVVDMDDVLISLNEGVASRLAVEYPYYSDRNLLTYSLNKGIPVDELPGRMRALPFGGLGCPRDVIFKAYTDVASFECAPVCEGAYEGLRLLASCFDVQVHTHSLSAAVAGWKAGFLEDLCSGADIGINLTMGKAKPAVIGAYAVFEDSLENLAGYPNHVRKMLVTRPHNLEGYNMGLIRSISNMVRIPNFYEGVKMLVEEG